MLMGRDVSWAVNSPSEMSILPQSSAQPALHSCPKAVLKLIPLPQVVRVTDSEDILECVLAIVALMSTWSIRWLPKGRLC